MSGFGQAPFARRGALIPLASRTSLHPVVSPAPDWTGTAASGFLSIPQDPVRTTAKPACHLLVPPGQFFTEELLVGVAAAANIGRSLIGGIDRVRFRFEGNSVDVVEPRFHSFTDARGEEVGYWGYWVRLRRNPGQTGSAQLFVEAIPADARMQGRVIGPFTFFLSETLHDAEYTIDPDSSPSATNFHTFDAAVARLKSDAPANPRITFKRAMTNVEMNSLGTTFTPQGYVTVEAEAPVTFGRASLGTGSNVDADSALRPRLGGLWLKGGNITLDFAQVNQIYAEDGREYVLEGVSLINSRGNGALWRGGPYWSGQRVRGQPYFLECNGSDIETPCVDASLVRGGTWSRIGRDIFSGARCVVGTLVSRQNDDSLNNDLPGFAVQYTGAAASATIERNGGVDGNDVIYTFRWGANSATFACGKRATYYAGTAGNGYTFADLVDWINVTLVALDNGWSATLHDTLGRRASSGSLAGLKAQPVPRTDCKANAVTVVSAFDAHGDWWQQRFNSIEENVIVYDNVGYDMQVQNIFLSSNVDARDFIFFNNALSNDVSGNSLYYTLGNIASQIGRTSSATAISHVVIAHCSMPNQRIDFRTDGTPSTFDSFCLIANNAVVNVTRSGNGVIEAVIENNHVFAGSVPLAEATGTTTGGNEASLFADFASGDFTPDGALIDPVNMRRPVVPWDKRGALRTLVATVGVL